MIETSLAIVRIGAAVYVGLCLLVYLRQSGYVYYPDRSVDMTPECMKLRYEDVRLTTSDGETLGAWFVPAATREPTSPVILYCHGNAGDIGDRVGVVHTLHGMGCSVLIFDYRGYGQSTGRADEAGTYEDARAAWTHLVRDRGVPARRIVAFGSSLGGAVAAWLAAEVRPAGLVLESSFTSATDMGRSMFPYLPVRWLSRFKYDTLDRMGRLECPVLIAHSRDDEMVPFRHAQRLFAAAREPRRLVALAGDHNAAPLDTDADYQRQVREFIEACTATAAPAAESPGNS